MEYYRLEDIDKPVLEKDMRVWADWYKYAPESWKIVASSEICEDTKVVTIYTGKDKQMREPGSPPLLWQTDLHEGDKCIFVAAYTTRKDAEDNHPWAVRNERYRKGLTTIQIVRERRDRSLTGRFRRALRGLKMR